jgi:hypothetical protein
LHDDDPAVGCYGRDACLRHIKPIWCAVLVTSTAEGDKFAAGSDDAAVCRDGRARGNSRAAIVFL